MAAPIAREGFAAVTMRLSALVIGQVCDASGCRECVVRAEGWVDSKDAWGIAYHLPSDPMRGARASGESGGAALMGQWAAMLRVGHAVHEEGGVCNDRQGQDAEGRR